MPTQFDLSPYFTADQLNNLPSFSNMGSLPTSGGYSGGTPSPGTFDSLLNLSTQGLSGAASGGGIADILTGGLAGLFGGGSSAPSWQPYVNAQGQYVAYNPANRNPVPVASVPGAGLSPSQAGRTAADQVQTIQNLLPYINQAAASGIPIEAAAQLAAAQQTSPQYAQLMTQLYNNYGPQLNAIGNAIQNQNALAQAGTTNNVLNGPGAQTVSSANSLQQSIDPTFYKQLAFNQGNINDTVSQAANEYQNGGLSPTEIRAIGQGLALNNTRTGTANAPSQSQTVANAMQYGQAAYQRHQQAFQNLSQALSSANSFLPNSRTGMDAFQIATGRSSQSNPGQSNLGNSMFPGITNTGSSNGAYGLAGNLLGGMNQSDLMTQANAFTRSQNQFGNQFAMNAGASLGRTAGQLPSTLMGLAI